MHDLSEKEIIEKLESYRLSKSWLNDYWARLDELESKLVGKTTTSIIVMGEGDSNESMRRTIANDKINKFQSENVVDYLRHYQNVVECEQLVQLIPSPKRLLVEEHYLKGISIKRLSMKYNYARTYLYKLIQKEVRRLVSDN